MEPQINRDIRRLFGRKKPARLSNSVLQQPKLKEKIDPILQSYLQKDEVSYSNPPYLPEDEISYSNPQYLQQLVADLVADLAADLDPHTVCSSSTEQLWLASFVSILELGASGPETRQFRNVASRLRLWGLSVGDMFDEGALPPTLNKLVQGILADIAVTLSKHENIFIDCLSHVNINRKLI
jgi:hypothetical protein